MQRIGRWSVGVVIAVGELRRRSRFRRPVGYDSCPKRLTTPAATDDGAAGFSKSLSGLGRRLRDNRLRPVGKGVPFITNLTVYGP